MLRPRIGVVGGVLGLAGFALPAQSVDPLPTEHVLSVTQGAHVDLDTGLVLPARELAAHRADLYFGRDGTGLFVQFVRGCAIAEGDEHVAPKVEFSAAERQILPRNAASGVWFTTTDGGLATRVSLEVVDAYGMGTAVLRWVSVPGKAAEFWPGPVDMQADWRGNDLHVRWSAPEMRFLVRVRLGAEERTLMVDDVQHTVENVPADAVCSLEVRGMRRGGVVTLPTKLVRFGRDRAAVRADVAFPGPWYDASGGLNFSRGSTTDVDADVVFYLYGVHVPGGGVQRIGRGVEAFAEQSELPEAGYLPDYGSLRSFDVLAVRTAHGRLAKVLLLPTDNCDLRNGMTVRYAWLADGRRSLLPRPTGIEARFGDGGVGVRWAPVVGAQKYRMVVAGQAPIEVDRPEVAVPGLATDRAHAATLVAVDALGEVSDPTPVMLYTFGPRFRVGSFGLEFGAPAGMDFAAGRVLDSPAPGPDLRVTGSWGSGEEIEVSAPHGVRAATAYGEFPAAVEASEFAPTLRLTHGQAFLVRTGGDGLASVRLEQAGARPIPFCYVLRSKE